MIQEDPRGRLCVAVVLGTAREAADFVRHFESGQPRAPHVVPVATPPTASGGWDDVVAQPRAAVGDRNAFDQAIALLRGRSGLTTAECVVLALRVRGFTNGAIARVLGIENGTVKCHVNNAMRRIGASAGTRPGRVLARALDEVRLGAGSLAPQDAAWMGQVRIALTRLEP